MTGFGEPWGSQAPRWREMDSNVWYCGRRGRSGRSRYLDRADLPVAGDQEEGAMRRPLKCWSCGAGLMVRISFPPAVSHANFDIAGVGDGNRQNRRGISG